MSLERYVLCCCSGVEGPSGHPSSSLRGPSPGPHQRHGAVLGDVARTGSRRSGSPGWIPRGTGQRPRARASGSTSLTAVPLRPGDAATQAPMLLIRISRLETPSQGHLNLASVLSLFTFQ